MLLYKKLLLMTFGTTVVVYCLINTDFYSTNGNICWHILVCVMTGLRPAQPRNVVRFLAGTRDFFIRQSIRTTSGAHLVPYSMRTLDISLAGA